MDENKSFAIGLNGKYLLDMLEVLEGERVNIGMGNELSPIKVEEDSSVHILMPIRLIEVESQPEPESEPEPEYESRLEANQQPEPEFIEEAEVD